MLKNIIKTHLFAALLMLMTAMAQANANTNIDVVYPANKISAEMRQKLFKQMAMFDLAPGDEALLRVFKKEAIVELWMKPKGKSKYIRFKNYPICKFSGELGPKLKQGDKQSPEGFYQVTTKDMNPNSRYYLSFDLGYPNQYDRYHGRTGDYLMIHGSCDSVGCYAMGNSQIEEIYYILLQAFANGQPAVNVHAFPFRLEADTLASYQDNRWYGFWQQLKAGYDRFNATQQDIDVEVIDGQYVIRQ